MRTPASVSGYSSAILPGLTKVGHFLYVTGRLGKKLPNSRGKRGIVGVLDIPRNRWRWIECLDSIIAAPKMFLYNDALYVLGYCDHHTRNSGKVSRFDLLTEKWSYFDCTGEGPGARLYFSGDYLEERSIFVVFGGKRDGVLQKDVHLLDMTADRWVKPVVKGKRPTRRQSCGSCAYGRVVFYYGGIDRNGLCPPELFMLTVGYGNRVAWSKIQISSPSPIRVKSVAMIRFNGKLVLGSGYCTISHHSLSVFDPKSRKLETVLVLTPQEEEMFAYGAATFSIDDGRSFGLLGGRGKLDCYTRVSLVESKE